MESYSLLLNWNYNWNEYTESVNRNRTNGKIEGLASQPDAHRAPISVSFDNLLCTY